MFARLLALLLTAAQAQPAVVPRDRASTTPASASVSGKIIDRETRQPMPRAIVRLSSADGPPDLETTADDDGRYEFANVRPGDYALIAGPGELRATHLNQQFGRDEPFDFTRPPQRGDFALAPGEKRTGADIALTRSLAIEGRVLDPWGEPMANMPIEIVLASGKRYPVLPFFTDDLGEYRAFGLAPGRYHVCALPEASDATANDRMKMVRSCHPSSAGTAEAADVVLTNADVAGADISIERTGTFTISGFVVNSAGDIVEAPNVSAASFDPDDSGAFAVGSGGQFILRGLMPGKYVIKASIDDSTPVLARSGRSVEREAGFATIDVPAADVSGVAVRMTRGRMVTGTIAFEGRAPVPSNRLNLTVQAIEYGPAGTPNRFPTPAVGDALSFELGPLFERPVLIGVSGIPEGWALRSVRFNGDDVRGIPTNFAEVADPSRIEIVLTDRVAEPTIRVTDEQDSPVRSFTPVVFPVDRRQWTDPRVAAPSLPSRDGTLKLNPLLPGEYYVAAIDPADAFLVSTDPARMADLAAVASRFTFAEGDRRTVNIKITSVPARK
jgi:hypothetical protein